MTGKEFGNLSLIPGFYSPAQLDTQQMLNKDLSRLRSSKYPRVNTDSEKRLPPSGKLGSSPGIIK